MNRSGDRLHEPIRSRWLTIGLGLPFLLVAVLPIAWLLLRAGLGLPDLMAQSREYPLFNLQREAVLFARTVVYALAVAATVCLVGFLSAAAVSGTSLQAASRWAWLLLAALPIPATVHALAWLRWAGLADPLGLFRVTARGWVMSWLVQSLAMLPIAVLIIAGGVLAIDLDQIQAAQLLGPDRRFALRLLPRLLQPQILAALAITLILTINDYAIPSIFSVNTYAIEVFVEYSSSLNLTRTVLKSLPLTVLQLVVLILSLGLVPRVFLAGRSGEFAKARLRYPGPLRLLFGIGPLLVLLQIAAPLAVIVLDHRMWRDLGQTAARAMADGLNSLLIALFAALLTLPIAYWTARWAQRCRRPRGALFLILLPAVLPATLIGTALIHLFNHPSTRVFYNSIGMPVLAALIRFLPFASLVVLAWLQRLDPQLLAAAWLLEKRSARNSLTIVLPLAATGLGLGAALVFLLGLGELGATVVAIPPGLSTFTIRLYNDLHYGATQNVLGLSFLMLLAIALGTGVLRLLSGRRRP
jgi:iron(III) transport system permease protein